MGRRKKGAAVARRGAHATAEVELALLADVGELVSRSRDAEESLRGLVQLIADRVQVDVCSLYLRANHDLVLRATHGLDPAAVGRVRMHTSEGLTGLAVETGAPVAVEDAPGHPRFKYFPETREELFHSFLGVPLIERGEAVGVLVIQTRRPRRWTRAETLMMSAVASQLVGTVVSATLIESLSRAAQPHDPVPAESPFRALSGTPAVPGIARGKAYLFIPRSDLLHLQPEPAADGPAELARLERAIQRSVDQVRGLHEEVAQRLSTEDASMFHAHLLLLQDRSFRRKIEAVIGMRQSARYAVKKVVHDYLEVFAAMEDPYLRERATDLEDVARRLLENLESEEPPASDLIPEGAVVVAPTLDLSLAAVLQARRAAAVATSRGGAGGHGVILARSLGIPAVVGIENVLDQLVAGDEVILDGAAGTLFVHPTREVIQAYEKQAERYRHLLTVLDPAPGIPAALRDGTRVELSATMGLLSDLEGIHRSGAEGIGLYRTEFPFYAMRRLPGEEEQCSLYRKALEGGRGLPVTLRLLDAGGDKPLPGLEIAAEENPSLGVRGLRLLRRHPDLLRAQLRAALRASRHGALRILVPMVASMDDWRWARRECEECFEALRGEGSAPDAIPPFGAMVETPSAVLLVRGLAAEADFLSIGTSDLIQYVLAVDRNNPHVVEMFDALDPAVLHAVSQVLAAAREAEKPVSICGEMAGHPLAAPLLVGLGARSLCVDANRIPVQKGLLRELELAPLQALAGDCLRMHTSGEVRFATLEALLSLHSDRVDEMLGVLLPPRG